MAETRKVLLERIRGLQERLDEAAETLRAIRSGEVDAILASGPCGDRVYTLTGAAEAYRVMVEGMAEGALTLTIDGLILFSNEQFATILCTPHERVIGSRIQDLVAPEDGDLVSMLLSGKAGRKAEVRLRTDGGALVPAYISVQNLFLDGVERLCVVVTDLSAQKRYEEILAVMQAVPAGVFIAQDAECRRIVGNRMAYELLRMPPATNFSSSALELENSKTWREVKDGRDIPTEELPMQTAARIGQPVHDFEFEVVFDDGASRQWLGNAVPLFDETQRPRGAVGAYIDITERKRAEKALERTEASLRHSERELRALAGSLLTAQEDERRRVARELHDDVTQRLALLSIEIGKLASAVPLSTEVIKERLRSFQRQAAQVSDEVRRLSHGLHPSVIEDFGLSTALEEFCAEFAATHGLRLKFRAPAAVSGLSAAGAACLYRIAQECLRNTAKHAHASEVSVRLTSDGGDMVLAVADNGVGFWVEANHPNPGLGLVSMRERVRMANGALSITSQPGQGTAIVATVPLSGDRK